MLKLLFSFFQLWLLLFDQCCVCMHLGVCVTLYFCPCVLLIADGTVRVSCLSPSRWRANTAEAESVRQMDWKSNNQATEWPWHLHACTAVQSQLVDTRALVARLTDWLTGHHYNVGPSFSIAVCVEMAGIKTVDRCDGLSCRFTTKWIEYPVCSLQTFQLGIPRAGYGAGRTSYLQPTLFNLFI